MKKEIESVGLIIRTKDNKSKEIPLEVWQVGAIADELGLIVRFPDLDDYQIRSEETYKKIKTEENYAIKYFFRKAKEAIKKKLGEYEIITRIDFYEKSDGEMIEIYKGMESIQEEFRLSKETLKACIEDVLE